MIQGGGNVTNETKERFVALAGGPNVNFVVIPSADERDFNPDQYRTQMARFFDVDVENVAVVHTKDRVRADSPGFVEPLRRASGVWIGGGRQHRLADAYLGTEVEREIKALLARGGVVGGGSAGAINLLGIGIDQDAAIVVHGDSFFVVGGQVAIHDGKKHNGARYYFLSSGQSYNLKTRSPEVQDEWPLALRVITAERTRSTSFSGAITRGSGVLQSRKTSESRAIHYECGVSLYSLGNVYPARSDGERQIKIRAREVNTDQLREYTCKF